ncbi:hypothetical protein VTK56DRAFT_6700 [Thermocarpiscus australiensis]
MPSRPATPLNRDPDDDTEYRFRTNGTPCEWGESYHPGGYHPVQLVDVLRDRYRIIRKIGYGAFSTAWLAVDLKSSCFVALKVAVASLSKERIDKEVTILEALRQNETRHITGLPDAFEVVGPNGRHACFAVEPMGPHIGALLRRQRLEIRLDDLESWERPPRFPKELAKRILQDTLLALRSLHSHGVVHGDLHPGNILANIRPLGDPSDESLVHDLQQLAAQGKPLIRRDGKTDLWAPSYLLEPAPLHDRVSFDIDPVVKLADLGGAFFEGHPPPKVVTPVALRAPETILGGPYPLGNGIDIWSCGCLVFELLTGQPLFVRLEALDGNEFDEETNDEHLLQLTEVLGPLPEEFVSRWRRRDKYYGPDGRRLDVTEHGSRDDEGGSGSDKDETDQEDGVMEDLASEGNGGSPPDSPASTSSQSSSLWLAPPGTFDPLERQLQDHKPDDMDESEAEEVSRLLRWILQYDASKRPSAEEILRQPWFNL